LILDKILNIVKVIKKDIFEDFILIFSSYLQILNQYFLFTRNFEEA